MHAGSLAGACTRLQQVATAKSTLPEERDTLLQAAALVRKVNVRSNRKESWEQYKNENKD